MCLKKDSIAKIGFFGMDGRVCIFFLPKREWQRKTGCRMHNPTKSFKRQSDRSSEVYYGMLVDITDDECAHYVGGGA